MGGTVPDMVCSVTRRFGEKGMTDRMGFAGLCVIALFAWVDKRIAGVGLALVLVSFLSDLPAFRRAAGGSPLVRWVAVTAAYILVRTAASVVADPVNALLHLDDGWRFIMLFSFLCVAWCMAANPGRIMVVLSLALAGFVVGRLAYLEWQVVFTAEFWRSRNGLGLPEIAFGFYAATAVIGLLIFAPRLFRVSWPRPVLFVALPAWYLLLMLNAQWVILSQSRGVWIATALILAVSGVLGLARVRSAGKTATIGAAVAIVSLVLLLVFNGGVINDRLSEEAETYGHVLSGQTDQVRTLNEDGSEKAVGTRVRMLIFGVQQWLRAPVFGQGSAATKVLLKQSEIPNFPRFNDLHNVVLELLVRLGLTGLILFAVCYGSIFVSGWRAHRGHLMPTDLFLFLCAANVLVILGQLTNFRMLNADWQCHFYLVAGALASFGLRSTGGSGERHLRREARFPDARQELESTTNCGGISTPENGNTGGIPL